MPPTIGQVVARLRRRRGLSQVQLQKASGGKINANWLGSLESGRVKNPPQDKLEILAAHLGTTVLNIYKEAGIVELPFPEGSSPDEQRMLEKFRSMTTEQQIALLQFLEANYPTPTEAKPSERERATSEQRRGGEPR